MRIRAGALFSLFLAAVAGYAIVAASAWPLKAALFPLVMGIPLLLLALAQLVLDLREEPSTERVSELARRRTVAIFAWMAGFVLLVLLVGLPLAVPLFVFAYLLLQSAAGWRLSFLLTAAAWGFFHVLFERLLRFPFDTGLVQTWLGQ
jgi:uncharacterized membrane protein